MGTDECNEQSRVRNSSDLAMYNIVTGAAVLASDHKLFVLR